MLDTYSVAGAYRILLFDHLDAQQLPFLCCCTLAHTVLIFFKAHIALAVNKLGRGLLGFVSGHIFFSNDGDLGARNCKAGVMVAGGFELLLILIVAFP